MESLAFDIASARPLVSALVVAAVAVFSLATFEQGIRHMVSDLRGARTHVADGTPAER